jgi:hypothetical protein
LPLYCCYGPHIYALSVTAGTAAAAAATAALLQVPSELRQQLAAALQESNIPVPENEQRWELALEALKGVWASKYNDRYSSFPGHQCCGLTVCLIGPADACASHFMLPAAAAWPGTSRLQDLVGQAQHTKVTCQGGNAAVTSHYTTLSVSCSNMLRLGCTS